jgi:hypothetical protein
MMANHFQTLGYTGMRADLKGYSEPQLIWWTGREQDAYRPDLTCLKNDAKRTQIILEAETCETIGIEHTRQQWRLFSARAKAIGGEFHVVVPKFCVRHGQQIAGGTLVTELAAEWGITVNRKWWPKE